MDQVSVNVTLTETIRVLLEEKSSTPCGIFL